MEVLIAGGLVRTVQGLSSAAPTLIVGLFISSVLRYYLGTKGTLRLFGGDSLRSLPQAWLVGMLLPVCSIGVIPILREMKRMGVRPGAITAFALSAPLFNPLSLLYGVTLSRPFVIVGFAIGSLIVVTLLGVFWDRKTAWVAAEQPMENTPTGLRRLGVCALHMARELCGPTGVLTLIAVAGLFALGVLLPHGALQSSVEQLDPWAPLKMAIVSVPIYATPMLTMSQLGMMFAHGNSPGAAFCLLLLGTGVNLATLCWVAQSYGRQSTSLWFSALFVIVLACAYTVDRPLIPPGVEPAGHTHAFDIYTNPYHHGTPPTVVQVWETLQKSIGLADLIGLGVAFFVLLAGIVARTAWTNQSTAFLSYVPPATTEVVLTGLNRQVSSGAVGVTCLVGLIALSVVACYAYYPSPNEVLEEMRLARVDVLSGAASRDYERALHWIPILEDWSRKLEVGSAMRTFELRPYQQMQAHLLRKKLELLEHAIEHAMKASKGGEEASDIDLQEELDEIDMLRFQIDENSRRLSRAFLSPPN